MACCPMLPLKACEVCTHNSQRFESYDFKRDPRMSLRRAVEPPRCHAGAWCMLGAMAFITFRASADLTWACNAHIDTHGTWCDSHGKGSKRGGLAYHSHHRYCASPIAPHALSDRGTQRIVHCTVQQYKRHALPTATYEILGADSTPCI